MKKSILYIGNKLFKHGNNATSIDTLGTLLENEGYTLYYSSSKRNKFLRIMEMIFKTLTYSRKVDFVLIDVYSTQNFWYAIIVSQLCRLLRVKYFAKLHGGNLPQRLKKNPYLCNLIFKNAYKNVAPSNYLKSEFSKEFSDNLIYIPNAIEIKNYEFNSREIITPKLLWVRSFAKIYNPKMAIKVFAELKNIYPEAELCMVGPDKENLIKECKLYKKSLNVKVKFTGKLSKNDWIELSKKYNVFINTTHFDNTPVSVIEAMALGLPVVSTNVGGIPFLLKDKENSILVNDMDTNEMVKAVEIILKNNDFRIEIISNARELAEKFDWNQVRKEWIKVLK